MIDRALTVAFEQSQIRTGPDKAVDLRRNDVAFSSIRQTEVRFGSGGQGDEAPCFLLRLTGDRADRNHGLAVFGRNSEHDRAGPVFQALFKPLTGFVFPQVGIVDDVSRFRSLP